MRNKVVPNMSRKISFKKEETAATKMKFNQRT